jgi:hypothetical protein
MMLAKQHLIYVAELASLQEDVVAGRQQRGDCLTPNLDLASSFCFPLFRMRPWTASI